MNINEITYAINGEVFEVNKILGPGFLEKVHENALLVELKYLGLKAENQAFLRPSRPKKEWLSFCLPAVCVCLRLI